jgi:hypothetical protein
MDLYNVNKYSDEQLYDILDMSHPTDRELEAKIIQMINKYENIPTDVGKQLYDFFTSIYNRFFDNDEEDDDEDDDEEYDENNTNKIEGMTNPSVNPSVNSTKNPLSDQSNNISTKEIGYQAQNISSVQQFDYSPDKLQLNPLLKQTIKRVISIDSQYRNISTDPLTTSFSFDLSEPLRDVVSLKLYSVQIPYTWYTVGKSFGSNFFYIKGNTAGVSDKQYQIAIPPGNYDSTTLPQAINKSFYDISNTTASDINFNGLDLITYDSTTAKSTVQLNIQNTFNESYYNMNFANFTSPIDPSNNKYSIPGYMGFNYQSYNLNTINSNQTYYSTSIINSQYSQNYVLDNSNNYFTVIQYLGYDPFSGYDERSKVLNQYKIQLMNQGLPYTGSVTRQNVIDAVNSAINQSNLFDPGSQIQQINITQNQNAGNSYFQLSLTLNRFTTKYVPNSKLLVIFPSETIRLNQYDEKFTIWQYQSGLDYSCFYFDNSINYFSQIISESPAINSTFDIDTSTNIIMRCTTPYYKNGLNDFSMNIQTGTYNTLTQYLSAITQSFANKNTTANQYFNMPNTFASLDINNTFNLQIDLTKAFTNKNYQVIIDGNSFLTNQNNFDISFSIVTNVPHYGYPQTVNLSDISNINISIQKIYNGYVLASTQLFMIQSDITKYENGGNGDAPPIPVLLSSKQYSTYDALIAAIQNALVTTPVVSNVNTQTPLSRSIVTTSQTSTDISMNINLNCYYHLAEVNYDISFVDGTLNMSDTNNAWNVFNINSFYDLSQNISQEGFALIIGSKTVGSASAQINIIDNCNNTITFNTTNNPNSPSDTITITIPPASYTIGTLYSAINKELSDDPKTYGSFLKQININNQEYTQIWININRIFTTADYIMDFYDTTNFVSCYAGSKSVQNTTWDSTIGWMLGFHDYTQYFLTTQNQTSNPTSSQTSSTPYYLSSSNGSYIITQNKDLSANLLLSSSIKLTGDTTLSTNLYNYFLISLDDFIQNHLNDGLVTITRSQTSLQIPDYSYSTTQSRDPATGQLVATSTSQSNSDNVTNSQLYSLNQSISSHQNPTKQYSSGPFIKDLFGIIPYKPPKTTGEYYTEFGGTLQNQERLYFGPVNIRKMAIQLLTDRGTLLDLNGSNWTFSFVCEQLYRSTSS